MRLSNQEFQDRVFLIMRWPESDSKHLRLMMDIIKQNRPDIAHNKLFTITATIRFFKIKIKNPIDRFYRLTSMKQVLFRKVIAGVDKNGNVKLKRVRKR